MRLFGIVASICHSLGSPKQLLVQCAKPRAHPLPKVAPMARTRNEFVPDNLAIWSALTAPLPEPKRLTLPKLTPLERIASMADLGIHPAEPQSPQHSRHLHDDGDYCASLALHSLSEFRRTE
jgi:hypothetical protein